MSKTSNLPADRKIGARIADARRGRQVSQTHLGRHLGVSFQQVQKYENGSNRVSAFNLWRISLILRRPVGFFFADLGKSAK